MSPCSFSATDTSQAATDMLRRHTGCSEMLQVICEKGAAPKHCTRVQSDSRGTDYVHNTSMDLCQGLLSHDNEVRPLKGPSEICAIQSIT